MSTFFEYRDPVRPCDGLAARRHEHARRRSTNSDGFVPADEEIEMTELKDK
jgi:hypothetical protein